MAHDSSGHSLQAYWIYTAVFVGLIVFTVVTVVAAGIDLGGLNVPVAVIIATLKAALVGLFFMHLRFEGRWVWGFAAFSIFLLFPLIAITLTDALHKIAW
ncbi:MAG: cytochrome C oxidase subunit IV family protein [Candidatus Methylomirabilales bacterium]